MKQIQIRFWSSLTKSMSPGVPMLDAFSSFFNKTPGEVTGELFFGNVISMVSFGWLDMNGKEIFEGDIIDFAGIKCELFLDYETGRLRDRRGAFNFNAEGIAMFARVLGNIYENPELLNKE